MHTNTVDTRLSIMVTHNTKRQLKAEAKAKRTTVGALVRQRIGDDSNAEEAEFLDALVAPGRRAESLQDAR